MIQQFVISSLIVYPLAAHLLLEFDVPEYVVYPQCLGQNWTKEEGEPNGGYPNSSLRERKRKVYSVTDYTN